LILQKLWCRFGRHDEPVQCRCKTCGAELHTFNYLDDESHRCKFCGRTERHEMQYSSWTREVPGMWSSDLPFFVQDVTGYRCTSCNHDVIETEGEPR
jgi:hypothetical protein